MLSPKQMLQELPIALDQVKADNTFKQFLNKFAKSLKKEYYNVMSSIKL